MLLYALAALFLIGTAHPVHSQTVPVWKFEHLNAHLNKKNDTLYVINFWATWCKPCVEELPHFERLQSEYDEKKVKVILVSLDFASKLQSRVVPFVKDNKIQSTVVLLNEPDYNAWIPKVDPSWSGSLPATLIFKNSNNTRVFSEKPFDYNELQTTVEKANQ